MIAAPGRCAVALLAMGVMLVATPARAAAPGASGYAPPACPARIATEQAATVDAAWRVGRTGTTNRLLGATFFDGPISGKAQLIETDSRTRGSVVTHIWLFDGYRDRIHLACQYENTAVILSRALPAGTRRCSITYDRRRPSTERVSCR